MKKHLEERGSSMEKYVLKKNPDGSEITVRDLQLAILEIMDEIHRVCVKNDIPYALIAGSALGICNYQGFIPWDDDIDMCVERKDWERFVQALEMDLDSKFYFQCFERDRKYNVLVPSMKIRKRGTYIKEVNSLLKNRCESGDGIFIDVVIYDGVSENKWVDEWNRFKVRALMPIMVLLDNIHINPVFLKKLVLKISAKYAFKNENSNMVSQTIAIPWEKFLKEPKFKREDVYPFTLYEFEGRQFYSYHNVKKVVSEWYGPNCLKKWNGKEWYDPLPVEKRKPKHAVDLNLNSEERDRK